MLLRSIFYLFCFALSLSCASGPQQKFELEGLWHRVEPADSVRSLAERYGADSTAIAELNDLQRGQTITGRTEVFIPKRGGEPPGRGPTNLAEKPKLQKRENRVLATGKTGNSRVAATTPVRCTTNSFGCLSWPVKGKVASLFGPKGVKHHDGIDVLADEGTPILAARDGTVLYSGDDIKGYGNLVILRHTSGILSIYAHNDVNLVREGDRVKEGEAVARVGQTGSASRPCLHFEVRVGEQPRDPLLYLP